MGCYFCHDRTAITIAVLLFYNNMMTIMIEQLLYDRTTFLGISDDSEHFLLFHRKLFLGLPDIYAIKFPIFIQSNCAYFLGRMGSDGHEEGIERVDQGCELTVEW